MDLFMQRKKINEIDFIIQEYLIKRFKLVKKIGTIKKNNGINVLDKKREDSIIKNIEEKYDDIETKEYLVNIYKEIMKESKNIQV